MTKAHLLTENHIELESCTTPKHRLLFRILFLAVLVFLFYPGQGFSKGQYFPFHAAITEFEARLAADVARDSVGGISAGVIIGDELIWDKGFGWADIERNAPMTPHSIGRTGSISKTFTAVLMLQLVQLGIIQLDEPVSSYLPEIENLADPPEDNAPITFRHLASHTSGLSREPNLTGAASGPIAQWEDKILASIPKTSYLHSSGEKYSYSNIGFGMLGFALSRAAGKSFMQLIEEYIFQPLDMTSSTFVVDESLWPMLSAGYQVRRDGTVNAEQPAVEHAGRGYKVPNGGIYSTVPDMAKFLAAMMGTSPIQILREKSREEMQAFQTPDSDSTGYGLGVSIRIARDGTKIVGHGGSVAGYNAYMCFNPESKIGIILFRNYTRGSAPLGRYAQDLLLRLVASVKNEER